MSKDTGLIWIVVVSVADHLICPRSLPHIEQSNRKCVHIAMPTYDSFPVGLTLLVDLAQVDTSPTLTEHIDVDRACRIGNCKPIMGTVQRRLAPTSHLHFMRNIIYQVTRSSHRKLFQRK